MKNSSLKTIVQNVLAFSLLLASLALSPSLTLADDGLAPLLQTLRAIESEAIDREHSSATLQAANRKLLQVLADLESDQGDGGGGQADCLRAAGRAGFSSERAQRVCTRANEYSGACIDAANSAGYSAERNERVCTLPAQKTAECISAAQQLGFSTERSEETCKSAATGTPDCLSAAQSAGFSVERSQRVCARASVGVGECIRAASDAGFSTDRIEATCRKDEADIN